PKRIWKFSGTVVCIFMNSCRRGRVERNGIHSWKLKPKLNTGMSWINFLSITKLEKLISPSMPLTIVRIGFLHYFVIVMIPSYQKSRLKNRRINDTYPLFFQLLHKVKKGFRMMVYSHTVSNHH